jgi:hypothetical protein
MNPATPWRPVRPDRARSLNDARLQLHHALQFGTALGIGYLDARPDDSHTNHGWDRAMEAHVSRSVSGPRGDVAIAIRPRDLTALVLLNGNVLVSIPLDGLTISAATERITAALATAGLDPTRYTLRRHFEIPPHHVGEGGSFDPSDSAAFGQLTAWYANAAFALTRLAADNPGAAEVRTWPHHFDIATLVAAGPGKSNGVGLSPGDDYYDEPYFYVNVYPAPSEDRLVATLDGGGGWHTRDWVGAVLPGSRLSTDVTAQSQQVRDFLDSALSAGRSLLG